MTPLLADATEIEIVSGGDRWMKSWHPPGATPPSGRRHGAAGICLVESGEVVIVSDDGTRWGFPGGRPEGDEDWEQTLRREVSEEACAIVTGARLLGFTRGRCLQGSGAGVIRVRSIWLARVRLQAWSPRFKIRHRRLVPFNRAVATVCNDFPEYEPLWRRAFHEAGEKLRDPNAFVH